MKIDKIISRIEFNEPATSFMPVDAEWIASVASRFPGMPDDLIHLYSAYGYGQIGQSRYMIHCLMEPGEIFDLATARELRGVFIVGDDYSGNVEAYDALNEWRFGAIDSSGKFEAYGSECSSFTDFLEEWFVLDDER